MFEKIPVYQDYSLQEPISRKDLMERDLGNIFLILDTIRMRWLTQKKDASLRRIYGILEENGEITIVIETSFKNPLLGKELEFSIAHTPQTMELYEKEVTKILAEALFKKYDKTIEALMN